MKHPLRCLAIFALALLFANLGNSCGYEGPEVVFIQHSDPDAPYSSYAAGRLGIVQPEYRIRHLVVAYNYLSGHPLTPAEQQSAVAADSYYNSYSGDMGIFTGSDTGQWAQGGKVSVDHQVPGEQYEYFTNCLSDAFTKANTTLADIRARYGKPGPDTPEIANWIDGQNAVFSNCSGAGRTPQAAPVNAPLWLRQDRAYQFAAAQFYALDYDAALTSFRAIAADSISPWSMLARYLVARVYIRQASMVPMPASTPQQILANKAKARASLIAARDQLQSILGDPAMQPIHEQSRRLLDYLMLRLDPAAQAGVLASRLTAPAGDPNYQQDVIDLTYAYQNQPRYASYPPNAGQTEPANAQAGQPLIRWIDDISTNSQRSEYEDIPESPAPRDPARAADAQAMWQQTHAPQWLVAALTTAASGAPENAKLIAAARQIPPASPAYSSATYQRLRLAAASPSPVEQIPASTRPVYTELSHLMPQIAQSQPLSTINQFADLRAGLAPTFDDFLAGAALRPVIADGAVGYSDTEGAAANKPVTLCGVPISAPDTRHLDDQTALIFNQRLPLRMLEQAALSPTLPGNVRFEIAHMAWTRALLLDRPEVARALTPYLAGCQPAFAEWLNQLNAARTPSERHVLGLMALMRFPSTEPVARSGIERDFAAYDFMRDNWWCSASAENDGTGSQPNPGPFLFTQPIAPRARQPDPPFITAADRAQTGIEIAQLERIPCASDYFARESLAWVKAHPHDPRDADIIGFAMRAVRNACRSNSTATLNHELFDVLHRRFPNSQWAARYKTWE